MFDFSVLFLIWVVSSVGLSSPSLPPLHPPQRQFGQWANQVIHWPEQRNGVPYRPGCSLLHSLLYHTLRTPTWHPSLPSLASGFARGLESLARQPAGVEPSSRGLPHGPGYLPRVPCSEPSPGSRRHVTGLTPVDFPKAHLSLRGCAGRREGRG